MGFKRLLCWQCVNMSEVGGVSSTLVAPKPGNRFRFRFVFVSCERASGRGEAAWAREGSDSSTLGLRVANSPAPRGPFCVGSKLVLLIIWCCLCGFYVLKVVAECS